MNSLLNLFHLILYQPLLNILVFLYKILPIRDFGLAVIILTILIRICLFPLAVRSLQSQKKLADLQPRLKEIQQKYKDNKEKQFQEIMKIYEKEKINPFSSLILLIQTPILIALYWVIRQGLQPSEMIYLYNFISPPEVINPIFLGLINLTEPHLGIAFLAGFCQFIQTKLSLKQTQSQVIKQADNKNQALVNQFSEIMQKQMLYFWPFFIVFILVKLPAVIGLYWLISSLFSIGQQYLIWRRI